MSKDMTHFKEDSLIIPVGPLVISKLCPTLIGKMIRIQDEVEGRCLILGSYCLLEIVISL